MFNQSSNNKTMKVVFLIISIIALFLVYFFMDIECTGWNIINPLCQIGNIVVLIIKAIISIVLFIIIVILLIKLLIPQEKAQSIVLFLITGLAAVIFWIIPDVIPFIDEIATTGISAYYLVKSFKSE